MELREIDLNLLLVFDQMLKQKRVSDVAATLGLSQPAISNALSRLRRLLGDELFLRTPRGMEPPPFASELAEPVAFALAALHTALNHRLLFDPGSSNRTFTIAMTDIGEICFLPTLMEELAKVAPDVTMSTARCATAMTATSRRSPHFLKPIRNALAGRLFRISGQQINATRVYLFGVGKYSPDHRGGAALPRPNTAKESS